MFSLLGNRIGFARRTVFLGILLTAATALSAQAAAPQPEQAPAGVSKDPVLVVSLASLDGLLRNVNHIATVSGMPQAGAMLNIYVGAYSQGIDRSEPLGLIVRMIDGAPAPMLFVAISDVKAFLKRLEPQFGPAEELEDGTLVMEPNQQTLVYIRSQGGWAYVSNARGALAELPENPKTILQELHLDHDIGIRANLQQVPEPMRMGLIAQMRQAFDDAVKRMQEQADGEVQPAPANEAAIKQMELLMRDTEYVTIGISVDPENNKIAFDAAGTAIEGSALAQMYNARKPLATAFAGVIRSDATVFTHTGATTGQQEQETALESLDQSLTQLRGVIDQYVELSDSDNAKIDQYLPRAKEVFSQTIRMGKLNGGAVVMTDENRLRVLIGAAVADGKQLEQLAKDILGEFEGNPDAPQFKFNDGTYKGLTLHSGHIDLPQDNKDLNKMFGSKLPLIIATGEDRLYFGAGKDIEELLKETVDASAGTDRGNLPLSHGEISLLPALRYAHWVSESPLTNAILQTLQNNPDHDSIRFVQPVEPSGQRIQVTIGDGVLQAIGAAAQAGRAQPAF